MRTAVRAYTIYFVYTFAVLRGKENGPGADFCYLHLGVFTRSSDWVLGMVLGVADVQVYCHILYLCAKTG